MTFSQRIDDLWSKIFNFLLLNKPIVLIVIKIVLLLACFLFVFNIIRYFVKNHIFELFFAKITKNVQLRDKIRKQNIKTTIEHKKTEIYSVENIRTQYAKNKQKFSGIKSLIKRLNGKVNSLLFYTGLLNIPDFSVTTMFILLAVMTLIVFIAGASITGIFFGIVIAISTQIVFWYMLSWIKYRKKDQVEEQLLTFINEIVSASMTCGSLIDIFGLISPKFRNPLKDALEYCYFEAKKTNNKRVALEHLKEKFDSMQFSFIIDNFILCSETTGDYNSVATNLLDTVIIYNRSYEKKKSIIRNSKVQIAIITAVSMFILFILSKYLPELSTTLFKTQVGPILIVAIGLTFFFGMTIKGDRD